MKTKIFLTALFLVVTLILKAQTTFQKIYSGIDVDYFNDVVPTNDGGYLIAGSTWSSGAGGYDILVLKTDSMGNLQWAKTYGTIDDEMGEDIVKTFANDFIIMGYHLSVINPNGEIILTKIDGSGNLIWSKIYGGINGGGYGSIGRNSCDETSDSGYVVTGATSGTNDNDLLLFKTDQSGNLMWTKSYKVTGEDGGVSVIKTVDGNIVVVGHAGYDFDIVLFKVDNSGNLIWSKLYGGLMDDWATAMIENNNGDLIISGGTRSFTNDDDFYLMKTDSNGSLNTFKVFRGSSGENCNHVQQTQDKGYILTGSTSSFGIGVPTSTNAFLLKTDSSFNFKWFSAFGGVLEDYGYSAFETNDKGYVLAGFTNSFGLSNYDMYLMKTDSLGLNSCIQFSGIIQSINATPTVTTPTLTSSTGGTEQTIALQVNPFFPINTLICIPSGIEENMLENKIKIYPNPSNNKIYLETNEQIVKINLFDINSSLLSSLNLIEQNGNKSEMDVNKLSSGVYIIELINKDGRRTYQKFLKQ